MASTTIREMLVRLGVKADSAAVSDYDKKLGGVKRTMKAAAAGAVALAVGLFAVAKSTANTADQAAKASQQIGISTEQYQELKHAAELSGASIGEVETAFRRQAVASDEARAGTALYLEAYKRVGISVDDLNGPLTDQVALFEATAEGMGGLATEQERIAVANALFGRSGAKLLPLLNQGADGIREMREEAQLLGFVIGDKAAKESEAFNDNLLRATRIVQGLKQTLGVALIPGLTVLLGRFRGWFVANRAIIQQRFEKAGEKIAASLITVGERAAQVDKIVRERFGGWDTVFKRIGAAVATLAGLKAFVVIVQFASAIKAALLAIGSVGAVALLKVVAIAALVAAAIAAVYLVVDDLLTYFRGGESAIGSFFEKFGEGTTALDALARAMKGAIRFGQALFDVLGNLADKGFDALADKLQPAVDVFADLLDMLKDAAEIVASGFLSDVGRTFNILAGGLEDSAFATANGGGSGAFAPSQASTASGAAASQSSTVNQSGATYNISGIGMSTGDVDTLVQRERGRELRSAMAIVGSGER